MTPADVELQGGDQRAMILECNDLSAGYGQGPDVISGLSLALAPGSLVGVVGQSGGGKSTLLGSLLGLSHGGLQVRSGSLRYRGVDITRLGPHAWRTLRGPEIAMIFQTPSASFDPLTRLGSQFVESVRLHTPHASKHDCLTAAHKLLKRLRFDAPDTVLNAYPFELSGGMLQRAAIAMALLSEPRVLLADEPTSALDVQAQAEVCTLLRETAVEFGTAVLFVSHQIRLMEKLVDEVHVLLDGTFVESGPTAAVLCSPTHPATRRFMNAIPSLEGFHAA
ncbi:MAG: ATP-binding cassette domain-containing protein [Propionibacteriaceae bacterium]